MRCAYHQVSVNSKFCNVDPWNSSGKSSIARQLSLEAKEEKTSTEKNIKARIRAKVNPDADLSRALLLRVAD